MTYLEGSDCWLFRWGSKAVFPTCLLNDQSDGIHNGGGVSPIFAHVLELVCWSTC